MIEPIREYQNTIQDIRADSQKYEVRKYERESRRKNVRNVKREVEEQKEDR